MRLFKPKLVQTVEPTADIVKGMYVMLDNGHETFWAHIASVASFYCLCIVCSRLQKTQAYTFGDVIQIQKKNILQVINR